MNMILHGIEAPNILHTNTLTARYTGSKLDYDATMKLLKAFNDFRS